jgi:hypothetical protein
MLHSLQDDRSSQLNPCVSSSLLIALAQYICDVSEVTEHNNTQVEAGTFEVFGSVGGMLIP